MARSSDATNDWRLQQSIGPLSGSNGPFTLAFWFKAGSNAQTNTYIMAGTQSGTTSQWAAIYEFVNNTVEFFATFSGTDPRTSSGLTVADTNWHHIAYRKASSGASAWDKFLDGTKTSINASINFTLTGTLNRFTMFGIENAAGAIVNETNAALQEVGIWDVALSDDQIAALAKGFAPAHFRAGGSDYYPLLGNASPEPNLWRGGGATVTNVVKADHYRVIYPRRPQVSVADAVAASFNPAWARNSNVMIGAQG